MSTSARTGTTCRRSATGSGKADRLRRRPDQASIPSSPLWVVVESALEGALVERYVRRFEARVGAGASPGPVKRVEDESGLDGVEPEVAVDREQVFGRRDEAGPEVPAEEVGAPAVDTVVVA